MTIEIVKAPTVKFFSSHTTEIFPCLELNRCQTPLPFFRMCSLILTIAQGHGQSSCVLSYLQAKIQSCPLRRTINGWSVIELCLRKSLNFSLDVHCSSLRRIKVSLWKSQTTQTRSLENFQRSLDELIKECQNFPSNSLCKLLSLPRSKLSNKKLLFTLTVHRVEKRDVLLFDFHRTWRHQETMLNNNPCLRLR